MGFLDFLFGKVEKNRYKNLENWLSGKVITGDEKYVLNQLNKIKTEIKDKKKKKAFERYIDSGSWKKVFVK